MSEPTSSETDAETPAALLDTFPALLAAECRRRGISQRAAAAELGLSPSTVTRIIHGAGFDAYPALRIMQWLDLTADWLREPDESANAYRRGWNDCAVHIRTALAEGEAS
jgi:transcriptional regulator with XRE-family HTH domain